MNKNNKLMRFIISVLFTVCMVPLSHVYAGNPALPIEQENIFVDSDFTTTLTVLLTRVDEALTYWKAQKASPYRYFLSKNPKSWFDGVWPQDEIESKIADLHAKQKEYFELLGACHKQGVHFKLSTEDYFDAQDTYLQPLMVPGHMAQYWGRYLTAAVAMGVAAYYGNKYQKEIVDLTHKASDNAQSLYQKHVIEPWVELKKLLWDPSENKKIQYIKFDGMPVENLKALRDGVTSVVNSMSDKSPEEKSKLIRDIMDGSSDYLAQLKNEKNESTFAVLNVGTNLQMINLKIEIFFKNIIETINKALGKTEQKFNDILEDINKSKEGIIDPNRLTSTLLSVSPSIGATVLGYLGIKKGLSSLLSRTKNYKVLHDKLIEVRKLLNNYNRADAAEFSNYDQGALRYFIYNLRAEAARVLEEHMLQAFLQDCDELENPTFYGAQKLETVHRMFDAYPFLRAD